MPAKATKKAAPKKAPKATAEQKAAAVAAKAEAKATLAAAQDRLAELGVEVLEAADDENQARTRLGIALYQGATLLRNVPGLGVTFPDWLNGYRKGRTTVQGVYPGTPKTTLDALLTVGRMALELGDESANASSYAIGGLGPVSNREKAKPGDVLKVWKAAKAATPKGRTPSFRTVQEVRERMYPDLAKAANGGRKGNGKAASKPAATATVTDPPKAGDRTIALSQLDRLMTRIGGGNEQREQVLLIAQEAAKIAEQVGGSTLYAVVSERLKATRAAMKAASKAAKK